MSVRSPNVRRVNSPAELSDDERPSLSLPLPPGRLIRHHDTGTPALWMTDGPVPGDLWAAAHAGHGDSGLWPLLLAPLSTDDAEFRPWASGELYAERVTEPGRHDPAEVLADWWADHTEPEGGEDAEERYAVTAPYGARWPGPAPAGVIQADPDALAAGYAEHLAASAPSVRLGLVSAARGADALAATGWSGPLNYTDDTAEIAAVVADWERRFGARVVGVGFADLFLSVAAPPRTLEEALPVAAEHFAICPDNVWQDAQTLMAYAERLVGVNAWEFWWD